MKTPHGDTTGEVVESYEIGARVYEIVPQSDFEYAVRIRDAEPNGSGITWIHSPNKRFETLGGARGAILLQLEKIA